MSAKCQKRTSVIFSRRKVTAEACARVFRRSVSPPAGFDGLPEEGQAIETASAAAPLTHQAFRQRQKATQLDGLTYKSVRVAWTDLGKGEPVILLHGIPTWSFLYNEVIPQLAQHQRVIAPDFLWPRLFRQTGLFRPLPVGADRHGHPPDGSSRNRARRFL